MASSSSLECTICMENYNDRSRRPKVLSCGHSLCLPCLDNCIKRNMKKCSVCRISFTAKTSDDIPVNTDLEKLIQFVSQLSINGTRTRKEILEEAQLNINCVSAVTSALENIISEKGKVISDKEAQIKCLLKEIDECNKEKEEASKYIEKNKTLTAQMNNSFIHSESSDLEIKVEIMRKHWKHIEEKYKICCSFKTQKKTLDNHTVKTPDALGSSTENPKIESEDDRKLWVGGLDLYTPEDTVREYFSILWQIDNCNLIKDRDTGRSKGFAFIVFANKEDMESALQIKYHCLDGRDVFLRKARKGGGQVGYGSGQGGGGYGGGRNGGNEGSSWGYRSGSNAGYGGGQVGCEYGDRQSGGYGDGSWEINGSSAIYITGEYERSSGGYEDRSWGENGSGQRSGYERPSGGYGNGGWGGYGGGGRKNGW